MMLRILEMTYADLTAFFRKQYGKGPFLAAALYREFYKSLNPRAWTVEAICPSPGLGARLEMDWQVNPGRVIDEIEAEGVVKFITELDDGHCIESVIIAMATHRTVCVSSQAEISVFREQLIQRGVNVQQRHPRRRGLMAACGQLGRCEPAEEAPRHP